MNSMILRHFHVGRLMWTPAVEKSLLSKLRKSTGYSFSKCKEALEKHENDLKEAEHWLKSQAQAHGWEKATKLQGRTTGQGLISILAKNSNAVMVETNCETDFVARNKKFQSLVQRVTQGVFHYSTEQQSSQSGNTLLSSITLTSEQLTNLPLADSRAVKDETAISIGELGENIQNRRSICFNATAPVLLAGYTHPVPDDGFVDKNLVQSGRYGVIVAYRPTSQPTKSAKKELDEVGRQLCQHIVGMNPTEIGTLKMREKPVSVPEEEPVVEPIVEETLTVEKKEEEGVEKKPGTKSLKKTEEEYDAAEKAEDEMCGTTVELYPDTNEVSLLNQEFLLDTELTVGEYLLEHEVEVLDFVRFEVGESHEASQRG